MASPGPKYSEPEKTEFFALKTQSLNEKIDKWGVKNSTIE